MTSSPDFEPTCPSGGNWYACSDHTKFVGCCTVNACTSTGCPDGNLEPAAFNAAYHGQFQDADCSGSAQFWTCATTNPTFMGCCDSNPCSSTGCPAGQLRRATLPNNAIAASEYDAQPPLTSSTSSSTSTSATSATSTTTTVSSRTSSSSTTGFSAAASATTTATAVPAPKTTNAAAIGGGVGGGIAGLLVIFFLVWLVRRHAKRSSEKHQRESRINASPLTGTNDSYADKGNEKVGMAGVTPTYKDSPSTVPAYSNEHTPAPQYPSGSGWGQMLHNQSYQYGYHSPSHKVPSAYQPYAPQADSPSHGHQTQFLSGLSPISGDQRQTSWGHSSVTDPSQVSQFGGHEYARVYQGPPQEMAGSGRGSSHLGLGVHHIGAGSGTGWEESRAELSSGDRAKSPS